MAKAVEQLQDALAGKGKPPAKKDRSLGNPSWVRYFWVARGDGYVLELPDGQWLRLQKQLDKWTAFAILNNKKLKGERPTLEQAFKAIDQILYKENKEFWLKTYCRAVLDPWMGDLNFDNSNRSNVEVDGGW